MTELDAAPDRAATGLSSTQLRWLMSGLMLGLFLSSIEQSVVATALPTIAGELGSANQIAWVVSVYLLTSTIVTVSSLNATQISRFRNRASGPRYVTH